MSITQDSSLIFEERRDYNGSGQVEFIGEAVPGTQDGAEGWRIHRRTYESNRLIKIAWANFNADFNKKYSDRESYDYR